MTIEVTTNYGNTKSKMPNPNFSTLCTKDQQVFSYLVTTLPWETAIQVASCQLSHGGEALEHHRGDAHLSHACEHCQCLDRAGNPPQEKLHHH